MTKRIPLTAETIVYGIDGECEALQLKHLNNNIPTELNKTKYAPYKRRARNETSITFEQETKQLKEEIKIEKIQMHSSIF